MDTAELRKARGAFFTPPELSRYIVNWAIRSSSDRVLEPSCGEASFLIEAAARLRELGAKGTLKAQLGGVEIHSASAEEAHLRLSQTGSRAEIQIGDFFETRPLRPVDALVGNPPYVRYQAHIGDSRARSLEAALAQGVRLNGLASSWAAFVIHAASFLKPDGRLGLVLPAELLSVNYAAEVRRFLLRRFARVRLVMFEQLIFPGVLEEVVLLLAEGSGGAEFFELYQTKDLTTLKGVDVALWAEHRPGKGEKWTPALLNPDLFSAYRDIQAGSDFALLRDWGQPYLGAVTGANKFFSLTAAEAKAHGLQAKDLRKISPPGSRHLRGLTFSDTAWDALKAEEARCLLFYPGPAASRRALDYIAQGEMAGVHRGYKCAARSPWWRVPLVETPDLFLTYMDHDRPRLVANEAQVDCLNSVYGVVLKPDLKAIGCELLPLASLNSVTLLGSEMVGRAYGGGLLKLEPREADLLPIPSRALVERGRDELAAIKPLVGGLLRGGNVAKAVKLVDDTLLVGVMGMPPEAVEALREGRELMFQRRAARGKGVRG